MLLDFLACLSELQLSILAVLRRRESYGYQICLAMRDFAPHLLEGREGALFPALCRLKYLGYIEAEIRYNSGRRRKYFILTKKGWRYLKRKRNKLPI